MPIIKYKDPVTGEYKSDIHVVGAVSSVNGKTGVVELTNSDITDAITDVQINGTSVVTDGVANVPQELFTVVYGSTTFNEITDAINAGKLPVCMNNGILYRYVRYLSNSTHYFQSMDWSAGKPNVRYFVVSSSNTYASDTQNVALTSDVPTMAKTAIASPVSTQYPAWTPAEQAAARERIGAASHNWKTKQEFTLGDEYADHSAFFTLNIDEENVSEIVIYFFSNGGAGTNNYWNARRNSVRFDDLVPCYFDSTATMSISRFVGVGDITLYECDATSNGFSVSHKRGAINAKITDIKTLNTSLNGATSVLGAGTKIVVLMK